MTTPRLPKRIYHVARTMPGIRKYGGPKGGTFAMLEYARDRIRDIRRDGGDAALFEAEVSWVELPGE